MNSISEYAKQQYEFVQGSRQVLFEYCKTISPEDLTKLPASFGGRGSIANLLVHISNTYEYWIAKTALNKNISFSQYDTNKNIDDVIKLFNTVNSHMAEFMTDCVSSENEIEFQLNGQKGKAKPFKLFSHVISHEYHHKGQILSLSRHLGYTPVDTDIMR